MKHSLLILLFSFFLNSCLSAQSMNPRTDIQKYVLTFYAISDTVTTPSFMPGDTLMIQWVQPASRQKYEEQPDPIFGAHAGAKYSVEIPNNLVQYQSDSLASVHQVVILHEGTYEMTVRAIDWHGNSSKESQPFRFLLMNGAPAVPVQVHILIRRHF